MWTNADLHHLVDTDIISAIFICHSVLYVCYAQLSLYHVGYRSKSNLLTGRTEEEEQSETQEVIISINYELTTIDLFIELNTSCVRYL